MAAPFVIQLDPVPIPLKVVAERMGLDVTTLQRWHRKGKFPAFRQGGKWYVNPVDLIQWKPDGDLDREGEAVEGHLSGSKRGGASDGRRADPVLPTFPIMESCSQP